VLLELVGHVCGKHTREKALCLYGAGEVHCRPCKRRLDLLIACLHTLGKEFGVVTAGEVCGAVAEVGSQTPASKIMMACIQSTWSKCTLEFWLLHQHKV